MVHGLQISYDLTGFLLVTGLGAQDELPHGDFFAGKGLVVEKLDDIPDGLRCIKMKGIIECCICPGKRIGGDESAPVEGGKQFQLHTLCMQAVNEDNLRLPDNIHHLLMGNIYLPANVGEGRQF